MSLFFGSGQKVKPQFSSLQVQTSSSNMPVAIAYGLCRLAPNLIWYGDFASHAQKQQGGKGGGGKGATSYTYSTALAMGLCMGVSGGIQRVFVDNDKNSSLSKLNLTFFDGSDTQSPWSYLVANHPDAALNYPGLVYVASPKYDLGQSAALPQHSFETEARLYNTAPGGVGDADVARAIEDFLTAPVFGCGFPDSEIGSDSLLSGPDAPTTGDNAMQTYCTAMGFGMSPAWASQEDGLTILDRVTKIFNTALVWNGAELKFIPYALDTITGNGVTYLPITAVQYSLTDDDYISGGGPDGEGNDPVLIQRRDQRKTKNRLQMEILSRAKEYNAVPIEWLDQGLVDAFGDQPDEVFQAHEVTEPAMATTLVSLMGQRNAFRGVNTYTFTLPASYCLLEPMDILEVFDPVLGLIEVQIDKINEDDENNLQITASQLMVGSTDSVGFTPPDQTPTGNDTGIDPGDVNTPILFEPPSSLTNGIAQVWAAVSGVDTTNWGGAFVWVSGDGGGSYAQIGEVTQPARMGVTTSALAAYASTNPDTVHTVGVNLSMSAGELISVSSGDASRFVTLCYIGGTMELLSYEDALLTSTYHYTLQTELYRALYGTPSPLHALGVPFARLDEAIFKYQLPSNYIGQALKFKFQSYNIYGGGVQDLSTCTAYDFTPAGGGFGTGGSGVPAIPTGLSGSAGAGFVKLTWNANSVNDNVDHYEIWRATGSSQPFGSASRIGNSSGTTYTDTSGTWGQVYTYFIVAVNAIGSSLPSTSINMTPTQPTITNPYGFAFSQGDPVISKPVAYFDTPVAWSLPAGIAGSQGSLGDSLTQVAAAPTAQTDFDIQSPIGTSIGTMRFAASATTATFIFASPVSIPLGQPVVIMAPSNLNGMKGKIYGSILGTR